MSSNNDNIVVQVENVSKKFTKIAKRSMIYGMRDILRNMCKLSTNSDRLRKDEFWAVKDASFEVKKGECLGIIGPNGSGKTTLLSLLNGIYMPDMGKIITKGKIGTLIAVGAGFHPMLTGRENIYINGAILGMNKPEINEKFDEIVEFAEIGEFLDTPVKNYSSGMYVRLGFSIATHCDPEILLIDEILSVGDLSFQNKCLRRLEEVRERANAVLFVSHNLHHVQNLCDRVMILDRGNQVFLGNTHEALLKYHEMNRKRRLKAMKKNEPFKYVDSLYYTISSGDIVLKDSGVLNKSGQKTDKISLGDDIILFFEFELRKNVKELYFSVGVLDERRINCIWQMNNDTGIRFCNITKGQYRLTVNYKTPNLVPGVYTPTFAIRNAITGEIYEKRIDFLDTFTVEGQIIPRGIVHVESEWKMEKT